MYPETRTPCVRTLERPKMKTRIVLCLLLLALGVFPALAQDSDTTRTLIYNDFSFDYDESLGNNVSIRNVPADPVPVQRSGSPQIARTQITLYDSGDIRSIDINLMDMADFDADYSDSIRQLDILRALLDERPDLSSYMVATDETDPDMLPFLPVPALYQSLRARAEYVDTDFVSGVSYVVGYRFGPDPFLRGDLRYTFQGLTADSETYISVVAHLSIDFLPQGRPEDFDYENYTPYLNDLITRINEADADAINPQIALLDDMVQSFEWEQAEED
jgi:hypothetical protein